MYIIPQDEGTGITESEADYADAATLSQIAYNPNATDFVVSGFSLSADYSVPSISVSQGVAKIAESITQTPDHSADGGPNSRTVRGVTYAVQTSSEMSTTLTTNSTNQVYLDIDPATKDYVDLLAFSDGSTPPDPYLHIGTVDTAENTTTERNRHPTATVESLESTGAATVRGSLTTGDIAPPSSTAALSLSTPDSQGTAIRLRDGYNNTTLLSANVGGQVDVDGGPLHLQENTLAGVQYTAYSPANGSNAYHHRVKEFDVGTSAVVLGNTERTAIFEVHGESTSDGTVSFVDRVTAHANGSANQTVLNTRNSPASRNYSVNGIDLEMAMASGTYRIHIEIRCSKPKTA